MACLRERYRRPKIYVESSPESRHRGILRVPLPDPGRGVKVDWLCFGPPQDSESAALHDVRAMLNAFLLDGSRTLFETMRDLTRQSHPGATQTGADPLRLPHAWMLEHESWEDGFRRSRAICMPDARRHLVGPWRVDRRRSCQDLQSLFVSYEAAGEQGAEQALAGLTPPDGWPREDAVAPLEPDGHAAGSHHRRNRRAGPYAAQAPGPY